MCYGDLSFVKSDLLGCRQQHVARCRPAAARGAAQALQGTKVPLAILPTGTVHVLARELGISLLDPVAAVEQGLSGTERRIDLGLCNGEPFLLMCSGGIDSATVGQVNATLKSAVDASAYAFAAIGALATFTPFTVRVTIDGVTLPETDIFLIAVGNTSLYGGELRLLPAARAQCRLLAAARRCGAKTAPAERQCLGLPRD